MESFPSRNLIVLPAAARSQNPLSSVYLRAFAAKKRIYRFTNKDRRISVKTGTQPSFFIFRETFLESAIPAHRLRATLTD